MRPKHLVVILVLLALVVPASPAHAGGVVSVCDEAHLRAALAGGGMVTFSCSGTIMLIATITIAADTTIDGSGQTVTISGNDAVGVFRMTTGVTLNLNELTIANGRGGGIYNYAGTVTVSNSTFSGNSASYHGGGGILTTHGTLTVSNSTFSRNSASGDGGGISNTGHGTVTVSNSTFSGNSAREIGGGISNTGDGTLTVSDSTFSGNVARYGGGISNTGDGTLTVSNCTFSDDNRAHDGGGISNTGDGTLTVSNSTFSGNSAVGNGGSISNGGTATLKNTIVANSLTGNNCYGTITDGGGNLSYPDTTCPGINSDPILGPLQNNGGPTETMALGWGSAALDAADDAVCAADPVNNLDQRGVTRPLGSHCDIGAVEQEPYPSLPSRMWLPTVHAQ